jgi:pyruvate,orthophosphate dikinase
LKAQVEKALDHIGKLTGKAFGDSRNPLLVSVRSGGRADAGHDGYRAQSRPQRQDGGSAGRNVGRPPFAYDGYRRFIIMYSDVVLGFEHHHFEDILDTFKDGQGYTLDTDLTGDDWVDLVGRYKDAVARETGHDFPQDPHAQLWGAIGAVFSSWMNARAVTYRRLHDIPNRAPPSTCRRWCSAIWARPRQPALRSRAIPRPARASCTANSDQRAG